MGPQTQLKYAVEIVIPRASRLLGIMEPVLERCVFEDMPANLWALKRRVEGLQVGGLFYRDLSLPCVFGTRARGLEDMPANLWALECCVEGLQVGACTLQGLGVGPAGP